MFIVRIPRSAHPYKIGLFLSSLLLKTDIVVARKNNQFSLRSNYGPTTSELFASSLPSLVQTVDIQVNTGWMMSRRGSQVSKISRIRRILRCNSGFGDLGSEGVQEARKVH